MFICSQYLILFFILTVGIKLAIINTYVLRVTWPTNQYLSGIIFGFVSLAIIYSPFYFIHKHKNKLAVILNFILSSILIIDMVYYSYFDALPTFGLLSSLGQAGDVAPAIADLLHWWLILYFIDIFLVIIFRNPIRHFFDKQKNRHISAKVGFKTSIIALFITIGALCLALLPMGLSKIADIIDSGYDTVSTAQYYGIVMAHGIDLTRFIKQETIRLSTDQKNALSDWVTNNKPTHVTSSLTGVAKGKNVIMIQVESLGGFVINQTINDKEITPNLNELAQTSQFFPSDRFIIGAGHTSDTDFVANTSYFPLTDAATFVRYGQDDFTSLPKILVQNGYSAYAYHGFNRNFWNRNVALNSLGYQKFYAADSYPSGAIINMGLNDGDFLSKTADYINDQPKPSLSYTITLSSHVPFNITDETKELGINASDYPNQVGGYLEDINYVDRMLGQFFDKLKSYDLYDDSLIIVYGDHTPVLPAFTAGSITYDPTSVQEKEVPLFVKLPNETTGKTYANQGTHLDIMPTVLDLLGITTKQLMFGQSLFANSDNALKICTDQLAVFKNTGDCEKTLTEEKTQSATIIRYNQFNNITDTN